MLHPTQLFDDKVAYPYIYKLWLDEQTPVDYGRQLLGCDKYLDPAMKISFGEHSASFEFRHAAGERHAGRDGCEPGALLMRGIDVKLEDHKSLGKLVQAYGLFRTLGMAGGASNCWHVANPAGVMQREESEKYNPVWDFVYFTKPKFTWPKPHCGMEFGGEMQAMNFEPTCIQHDPSIQAVLLPPWSFLVVDEPVGGVVGR
jgi:hypothetical protein